MSSQRAPDPVCIDKVRASREGHTYHDTWTARVALELLVPTTLSAQLPLRDSHARFGQVVTRGGPGALRLPPVATRRRTGCSYPEWWRYQQAVWKQVSDRTVPEPDERLACETLVEILVDVGASIKSGIGFLLSRMLWSRLDAASAGCAERQLEVKPFGFLEVLRVRRFLRENVARAREAVKR